MFSSFIVEFDHLDDMPKKRDSIRKLIEFHNDFKR